MFEVCVGGEEGPSCRQKAGMHHDTSDLCRHWPLSGFIFNMFSYSDLSACATLKMSTQYISLLNMSTAVKFAPSGQTDLLGLCIKREKVGSVRRSQKGQIWSRQLKNK